MTSPIHVIDPDYRRRARIAHELRARSAHAEIYEDLAEFCRSKPSMGVIFAADEGDSPAAGVIVKAMQDQRMALPLILYAPTPALERAVSAILLGALDYLEWPFVPELLDRAFERIATEGERRLQHDGMRMAARAKVDLLTSRERDVLKALIAGLPNKDIGEALHISPRTVEIHRANMMRKLGATSTADAVRVALYAEVDAGLHLVD